jgi:hypothetical protein
MVVTINSITCLVFVAKENRKSQRLIDILHITEGSLCPPPFLYSYHFLQARLTYTLNMDASGSSETLTRLHTAQRKYPLALAVKSAIGKTGQTGKSLFPHVNAEMWALTAFGITPCNPRKVSRRFGGKCHLHLQGWRTKPSKKQSGLFHVGFLAYSSSLEMEVRCSSEMSVDFQRTACRCIPEDGTLRILRRSQSSKLLLRPSHTALSV